MYRSFSFTSSTILDLMSVFKRHKVDFPEHLAIHDCYSKKANDAVEDFSESQLPSLINPHNSNHNSITNPHQENSSPIIPRLLSSADSDAFSSDPIQPKSDREVVLARCHFKNAIEGESDASDEILEASLKRFTDNLRDKGTQCSSICLDELLRSCDC